MNKRNKRILLLILLLLICAGGIIGYKMWNKPFEGALSGEAIKVNAYQLFQEFSSNENSAREKYVPKEVDDKKLEVTGTIREAGQNQEGETWYILNTNDDMFGVKCVMEKSSEKEAAKKGDSVSIRGYCSGYNMDVILNRCRRILK